MTPAQVALARELAERSWWEWRAGMLVAARGEAGSLRLFEAHADMDGRPNAVGLGKLPDDRTGTYWTEAGDVPDLTDAATAGVLLGLLAAAVDAAGRSDHTSPYVLVCHDPSDYPGRPWCVELCYVQPADSAHYGATLGEAVARALLAVRP